MAAFLNSAIAVSLSPSIDTDSLPSDTELKDETANDGLLALLLRFIANGKKSAELARLLRRCSLDARAHLRVCVFVRGKVYSRHARTHEHAPPAEAPPLVFAASPMVIETSNPALETRAVAATLATLRMRAYSHVLGDAGAGDDTGNAAHACIYA